MLTPGETVHRTWRCYFYRGCCETRFGLRGLLKLTARFLLLIFAVAWPRTSVEQPKPTFARLNWMLTQLSQDARPRERCLCVRWHFSCLRIGRSASKVGGPCKVGIADVDRGGFGEAPMFWMLQIVDVSVPPGAVTVPQSRTDTTDFRFSQSKATGVPQKTQRCEARQQKLM